MRVLIALLVWVGAVAGAAGVSSVVAHSVHSNGSASPGDSPLFSLARVRADVPAALAQRIATAGHVPKSQLRYMIAEVDSSDHRFHWLIYTQPGSGAEYFQVSGPTGPLFEYRTGSPTGLQRIRG